VFEIVIFWLIVVQVDKGGVVDHNKERGRICNTLSRSHWRIYTKGRPRSYLYKSQCCVLSVEGRGPKTHKRFRNVLVARDRESKSHYDK
jgi:hypothetical protein